MKHLINFIFLYLSVIAVCSANDLTDEYQRRKKEGVKQLTALMRENARNNQQGLAHRNWYIFNDDQPIRGQLRYFPELDQQLIKKLNDQLIYFNQTGVRLYVYFGGLKVMPTYNTSKNDPAIVDLEAKIEKMGLSDFEKARLIEEKLVRAIFRESGLRKSESILAVNKYFGLEAKKITDKTTQEIRYETTPYVMYIKTLASGQYLVEGQKKILAAVSKADGTEKDTYKFTIDANAALQNFVKLCVDELKEFQPTPQKPRVYAYMLTHNGLLLKDEYLASDFNQFSDLQTKVFRFFYQDTPEGDFQPLIARTTDEQNQDGSYSDAFYLKEQYIEYYGDTFAEFLAGQLIKNQRPKLWQQLQKVLKSKTDNPDLLIPNPEIDLDKERFTFYGKRKFEELFKVEKTGAWARYKRFYKAVNQSPFTFTRGLGKQMARWFKFKQIPPKYWDFDSDQMDPMFRHFVLFTKRPTRNAYVFLCGFYNGVLKQAEGMAQLSYMLSDYLLAGRTKTQIDQLMEDKSWWELMAMLSETVSKMAAKHWDDLNRLNYKSIYLMGKDLAEVLGLMVGVGELKAAYQGGKFLLGTTKLKLLNLTSKAKQTFGVLAKVRQAPRDLIKVVIQIPKKLYQIRARRTGEVLATVDDGIVKVEKWVWVRDKGKKLSESLDNGIHGKHIAQVDNKIGICLSKEKGNGAFTHIETKIRKTSKKLIGQSEQASCVAASCRMLMEKGDNVIPEVYFRDAVKLDPIEGASLSDAPAAMADIADYLGMKKFPKYSFVQGVNLKKLKSLLKKGSVIVSVKSPLVGGRHALVVDKIGYKYVYIRDPLPNGSGASYSVKIKDFLESWEDLGKVVHIE